MSDNTKDTIVGILAVIAFVIGTSAIQVGVCVILEILHIL